MITGQKEILSLNFLDGSNFATEEMLTENQNKPLILCCHNSRLSLRPVSNPLWGLSHDILPEAAFISFRCSWPWHC